MTAAYSLRNSEQVELARDGAPPGTRAEIAHGSLLMAPAPRATHQFALGRLLRALDAGAPLRRRGGPTGSADGWLVLLAPEIHLGAGPDKLNPDLAGWRGARAPSLEEYPFTSAPDWICEVLSPSTEVYDRAMKLPLFAGHGSSHAWLVDPDARSLEVFSLVGGRPRQLARHDGDALVRAAPFDDVELALGALWA